MFGLGFQGDDNTVAVKVTKVHLLVVVSLEHANFSGKLWVNALDRNFEGIIEKIKRRWGPRRGEREYALRVVG